MGSVHGRTCAFEFAESRGVPLRRGEGSTKFINGVVFLPQEVKDALDSIEGVAVVACKVRRQRCIVVARVVV